MCGIAAIFSFNESANLGHIEAMTDIIRDRGPDDEGFVFFHDEMTQVTHLGGKDTPADVYQANYTYTPREAFTGVVPNLTFAAMGHRRLSIIDLSPTGHQPMCTADSRYWIVYNGEVYNHIELRQELEILGYCFHSHCDTEVILNAYRHWGGDCLHRFNGMFAFIIFDRIERKVFVARDRFGVKPLYYWISPSGFLAIASEIKQFTVLADWRAKLNGQRVYDFLNWGIFDHTRETLFAEVLQICGGEYAECGIENLKQGLPVTRWYNLKSQEFQGSYEDAAITFRHLLCDSVRLRLRADVSVGSCLSGGLDSSSIVCIVNDILRAQSLNSLQKTFSACALEKRFDEREFIDEVVKTTGVEAHYTYPSVDDLFDTVDAITWHQDEPFGSTSIYAQWHVFKLAAENGVKVMLDGQGADEQLAGYHVFFTPRLLGLFKSLHWLALWQEIQATKKLHGYGAIASLQSIAYYLIPEMLRQPARRILGKTHTAPDWLDLNRLGATPLNPLQDVLDVQMNAIANLSYAQLTATNLPMLLHWEDRNSMAHSVESRVPFLDYRLVEFVLGLPDEFKLSKGITKRVLRSGMKDILPERIRLRMDKMGFVTPEEVWVREHPEQFRTALKSALDVSQGILNLSAMHKLERIIAGEEPFSFLAWRLISFGRWIKIFKVEVVT